MADKMQRQSKPKFRRSSSLQDEEERGLKDKAHPKIIIIKLL